MPSDTYARYAAAALIAVAREASDLGDGYSFEKIARYAHALARAMQSLDPSPPELGSEHLRCATCAFAFWLSKGSGACWRHPPRPGGGRPLIERSNWCGEHSDL